MGKKSKRFGKGFEYEVRDILRKATGIQSFERVPSSGAWIGGKNAYKAEFGRDDVTEIMAGDLICPLNYRWCIECKNYVDLPIHQLFFGERCFNIDRFIEQVLCSSTTTMKEPLLIIKYRKSGHKPTKRIIDLLKGSNIKLPQTNTTTVGIFAAELAQNCEDIKRLNHIYYDNKSSQWRFFDIQNWIKKIQDRQFKK